MSSSQWGQFMPLRWREITVTDLTILGRENRVCLAGIERGTNAVIRPLPYLTRNECSTHRIYPSVNLQGLFMWTAALPPHMEDRYYFPCLRRYGELNQEKWLELLKTSAFSSVKQAFAVDESLKEKCVDITQWTQRSLATVRIDNREVQIKKNRRNSRRLRLSFVDNDAQLFTNLPMTELSSRQWLETTNSYLKFWQQKIAVQEALFLRLGLTRFYCSPKTKICGYWLQVNGLYGFPDFPYGIGHRW